MQRAWVTGEHVRIGWRFFIVGAVLKSSDDRWPRYLLVNHARALLYVFDARGSLRRASMDDARQLLAGSSISVEEIAVKAALREAYLAERSRRINTLEFDHV
jgi:hypothetical protein